MVDYIESQMIKIKNNLNNNLENITKEMLQYSGRTSKIIIKIEDFKTNKIYYLLEIDNCNNIWDNNMIEEYKVD